uniref:Putative ovule protein n=1 Tax=Solanum chacoense TaxID=4108 RepID=A0A0V0IZV1_SOLCH
MPFNSFFFFFFQCFRRSHWMLLVEVILVSIIGGFKEAMMTSVRFLFPSELIIGHLRLSYPYLGRHAPRFSAGFCSHGVVGLSCCLSSTKI